MATQQTDDTRETPGERRTQLVIDITPALRRARDRRGAEGMRKNAKTAK